MSGLRVFGIMWSVGFGTLAATHLAGGSDHALFDAFCITSHAFFVQYHFRAALREGWAA